MMSPPVWRAPSRSAARRRFKEWRGAALCSSLVIVGIVGTTLTGACDTGGTECQCDPTGLLLQICPELASSVTSIQTSGSACIGAKYYPVDAGPDAVGEKDYVLEPVMEGMCGVEVSFSNGLVFSADQVCGGERRKRMAYGPRRGG
jgi:hypothetical protein